jgi:hypothetical protein
MGNRSRWVLGIALLASLVWALEQVTIAPLETGEVYPFYSSLRADPLGAKALYDSLAALPELSVERWYKERSLLSASGASVLLLGVEPVEWSGSEDRAIDEDEALARGGARLVLGFLPVRKPYVTPNKRPVETRWNVKLSYRVPKEGEPSTSRGIPRETSLYFEPGPEWRRLDASGTVIERTLGSGAIVLVAETFPLSNEGLLGQRDSSWIARVLGSPRKIVFDENHLGVAETGSVTTLMRKYHLEGAIAVLGIVTALFLWRSATSFLPPAAPPSRDQAVSGRDAGEALVSLLRRGIPEKDLLDACYAEWSRSAGHGMRAERSRQQVEEEIARLGKTDPVAAYRAAHRILSGRPL